MLVTLNDKEKVLPIVHCGPPKNLLKLILVPASEHDLGKASLINEMYGLEGTGNTSAMRKR